MVSGKDLRLGDHAARQRRERRGLTVFVLDPYFFNPERASEIPHRMQFMLDALARLPVSSQGLRFCLSKEKRGCDTRIVREWSIDRVVAHRWVEPFARERDEVIADSLDVPYELFEGET